MRAFRTLGDAMLTDILLIAFAGLMVAAALSDAVRFTIPNWLCGVIIALFPLMALAAGIGWSDAGGHLLAGTVALVFGFALFAPGWIGGGDAKLIAAAALWMGWTDLAAFAFHTALAGGALVMLLLAARRMAPVFDLPAGWVARTAIAEGAPVPYGIAIAAGALWTLPGSAFVSLL